MLFCCWKLLILSIFEKCQCKKIKRNFQKLAKSKIFSNIKNICWFYAKIPLKCCCVDWCCWGAPLNLWQHTFFQSPEKNLDQIVMSLTKKINKSWVSRFFGINVCIWLSEYRSFGYRKWRKKKTSVFSVVEGFKLSDQEGVGNVIEVIFKSQMS